MPGFIKDLAQIDEKFCNLEFLPESEIWKTQRKKNRKRKTKKEKEKNREQDTILIALLQNSCFLEDKEDGEAKEKDRDKKKYEEHA